MSDKIGLVNAVLIFILMCGLINMQGILDGKSKEIVVLKGAVHGCVRSGHKND